MNSTIQDTLQHEGINARGFGNLPKIVMRDRAMKLESKAIYALLVCLAGKGNTSYPSIKTICRLLNISEDRYRKHVKALLDFDYISVKKTKIKGNRFANSIYTINSNPKLKGDLSDGMSNKSNYFRDLLEVEGVNSKGYGSVPYTVFEDTRTTIEAISIYGYFCSFSGGGTTSFPKRDEILKDLGMSKDRYYKNFNLLKEYGYISTRQKRQKGSFLLTIYTLNQKPAKANIKEGTVKNSSSKEHKVAVDPSTFLCLRDTVEKTVSQPCPCFTGLSESIRKTNTQPCPCFTCTEFTCTENPCTGNKGTIINRFSFIINRSLDHKQSEGPSYKKLQISSESNTTKIKKGNKNKGANTSKSNAALTNKTATIQEINQELINTYGNAYVIKAKNRLAGLKSPPGVKGYRKYMISVLEEYIALYGTACVDGNVSKPAATSSKKETKTNKYKTRFHLATSRTDNYTAEELEAKVVKRPGT